MRIILLKSMTTPHAKYSVGTILNYSLGPALKLINEKRAKAYKGPYPPRKKMKINLRDYGNN